MYNRIKIYLLTILLSLLLVGCGQKAATSVPVAETKADIVVAEGHVIPKMDLKLFFSARGKIAELMTNEGQFVKKGDTLARLGDSEQAQAALAAANLELTKSQQVYDDFIRKAGLSSAQDLDVYQKAQVERSKAQLVWEAIDPNQVKDDIDSAQTDVQDKKKLLEDANDTLKKYLDLKSDNPTRRQAEDDVRTAEADFNTALRKVEDLQRTIGSPRSALDAALASELEAKRNYENTKNNTLDPDKKVLLQASLDNATAQVKAAQAILDNYDLSAPFDGLVTDVNITPGELIGSDKYAFQLADTSEWFIETSDLTELEVVKITLGQAVEIAPDALPDTTLNGTVENISDSYKSQGGDILYTVKIKLENTDPNLRWGMTVQTTFMPASK